MKWTREVPTTEGFYWFRGYNDSGEETPFVTHVSLHGKVNFLRNHNDVNNALSAIPYMMEYVCGIETFDGEWAGPIEMPE